MIMLCRLIGAIEVVTEIRVAVDVPADVQSTWRAAIDWDRMDAKAQARSLFATYSIRSAPTPLSSNGSWCSTSFAPPIFPSTVRPTRAWMGQPE